MKKLNNFIIASKNKAGFIVDDAADVIKAKKKGDENLISKVALALIIIVILGLLVYALKNIFFGSSSYDGSTALANDSFMGKIKTAVLGLFN